MLRRGTALQGRRSVLLSGAAVGLTVLTACAREEPIEEGKTVSSSPLGPQQAREEIASLLDDAQSALDEEFAGLSWEESSSETTGPVDVGCRLTLPARRCDRYLGRDSADHATIEAALSRALEAHGLPAAPRPAGGTGGWLTTSSSGEGITLGFRAKGFTELTVHVDLAVNCEDVD